MNKFRKLGFIRYNGGSQVHSSLLNLVLRDQQRAPGKPQHLPSGQPAIYSAKGVPIGTEIKKYLLLNRHSIASFAIVSEWRSVAAYMSKTYSDWLGRQVVLQIEAGESLVSPPWTARQRIE
jgi:hypothetical protein